MATKMKLGQVLAIEQALRGDTEKAVTARYHELQKAPLLSGLTRSYRKIDDDDPDLPGEATKVQLTVEQAIADVARDLTRLLDVTAARDWTNCRARADVIVDGTVVLKDAPVTYLLFLEKTLVNVETFVRKLPTLDPAEDWALDETTAAWRCAATETTRTKKVLKNHRVAPATKEHPEQVQVYTEDVVVGYWRTVKFSGAVPAVRRNQLLDRVIKLAMAVKVAREEANVTLVDDPKPAKAIFDWLFA